MDPTKLTDLLKKVYKTPSSIPRGRDDGADVLFLSLHGASVPLPRKGFG